MPRRRPCPCSGSTHRSRERSGQRSVAGTPSRLRSGRHISTRTPKQPMLHRSRHVVSPTTAVQNRISRRPGSGSRPPSRGVGRRVSPGMARSAARARQQRSPVERRRCSPRLGPISTPQVSVARSSPVLAPSTRSLAPPGRARRRRRCSCRRARCPACVDRLPGRRHGGARDARDAHPAECLAPATRRPARRAPVRGAGRDGGGQPASPAAPTGRTRNRRRQGLLRFAPHGARGRPRAAHRPGRGWRPPADSLGCGDPRHRRCRWSPPRVSVEPTPDRPIEPRGCSDSWPVASTVRRNVLS